MMTREEFWQRMVIAVSAATDTEDIATAVSWAESALDAYDQKFPETTHPYRDPPGEEKLR